MGWYVLETNAQATQAIQDRITILGAATHLFQMRRITRSHHRNASPFIPIFPGYLFVQLSLPRDRDLVTIIKRYEGVKSWLGMRVGREAPLRVKKADIKRLCEMADEMSVETFQADEKPTILEKGTVVRILWGNIQGLVGEVEFDNGIRADVLLGAAGLGSKISLPRELIQAA